jgi:hypothetical protein
MNKIKLLSGRLGLIFSLAGFLVAASGCRGDRPPLGRVSGTVTLDGRPLEGVEVSFVPESGRPSIAVTNAAGGYQLIYVGAALGAKVGSHRVSINYPLVYDDDSDGDNGGGASRARGPQIPGRYNLETTLTAEVGRGRNTFDFALESK